MDLTLTATQLELRARAQAFVRDVLQPREVEFERANGRVPRDWGDPIRRAAIAARLHGGSLPLEAGGQGWSVLDQVLVHEQLGQSTGGLWSYIPGAYNVLVHADADQRRRYLDPCLRGERSGSYAITEDAAGSGRGSGVNIVSFLIVMDVMSPTCGQADARVLGHDVSRNHAMNGQATPPSAGDQPLHRLVAADALHGRAPR